MIGLDTNVLLRIVLADDARQQRRSLDLLESLDEPIVINSIVLAEATWTLEKKRKAPRERIASFIADVLDTSAFEVTCPDAARRALGSYRQGRADYADYLIAEINAQYGCRTTYSFDRAARGGTGFSPVP